MFSGFRKKKNLIGSWDMHIFLHISKHCKLWTPVNLLRLALENLIFRGVNFKKISEQLFLGWDYLQDEILWSNFMQTMWSNLGTVLLDGLSDTLAIPLQCLLQTSERATWRTKNEINRVIKLFHTNGPLLDPLKMSKTRRLSDILRGIELERWHEMS